MKRFSNSLGCHNRYDGYTDEELIQIYNELQENDDDLVREIFYRLNLDYEKIFHVGEEDFNDNTLDIDKIINDAINELQKNIDKEDVDYTS